MQDRFKFRAWHKTEKRMFDVESICPYQDKYTMGGEVFLKDDKISKYFPEEVILLQCTGLKDKYGKLIYEGDIVKTTLANNSKITFLVVWNDKNATFDGKIIKKEMTYGSEFMIKQDYFYYLLGNGKDEKAEVIGNKFQNPELLSEVK